VGWPLRLGSLRCLSRYGSPSKYLSCHWAFSTIPVHPQSICRIVQEYMDPPDRLIHHKICFRGRTSGLRLGYTRYLTTAQIHGTKKDATYFGQGYSFAIRSWQIHRPPRMRPGDSGSWVWDCSYGPPVAQIICEDVLGGIDASLEHLFNEFIWGTKWSGASKAVIEPVKKKSHRIPAFYDLYQFMGIPEKNMHYPLLLHRNMRIQVSKDSSYCRRWSFVTEHSRLGGALSCHLIIRIYIVIGICEMVGWELENLESGVCLSNYW